MKRCVRLVAVAATVAIVSGLASCASAPVPPAATLRDLTAQCAARASVGGRDTSAIYRMEAVTTQAAPLGSTHMPDLGGPGRKVVFAFVVDTLGAPDLCNAWVEQQSVPGLGDRALTAAAGWHFTPATYQGRKVRQLTVVVIESPGAR